MKNIDKWKTAAGYAAGFLILAVSVVAAVFGPDIYSDWQDERLVNQVTLSSRPPIQFLDANSLDIMGRLKMLDRAQYFNWSEADYYYYYNDEAMEIEEQKVYQHLESNVQTWCDLGLLPAECVKWLGNSIEEDDWRGAMLYSVYVDQKILPVWVVSCYSPEDTDELTLVVDLELDMIYYASVSGPLMMDYMANAMGCGSVLELQEKLWSGEEISGIDKAVGTMEFAGVCGAESAAIEGTDENWLGLDIELLFSDFSCTAHRVIIRTECGYGLAICYGTVAWFGMVDESMLQWGFESRLASWDEWVTDVINDYNLEDVYGKEMYKTEIYDAAEIEKRDAEAVIY